MTADPETRFRRVLVGSILCLSLLKAVLHEPWRDEWGAWGVSLGSGSYRHFLFNVRYSGHPHLWASLVFAIQRTFGDFLAVQALQALIATATAYAVARWAPLPRTLRALAVLGYFPFFEYGVIARPYGIAILTVCAACAVYARRPRDPLALAVPLAVLVQTSVYGVFLAGGFAAAWGVDSIRARRDGGPPLPAPRAAAAGLLLAASTALAVMQMMPPADSGFARQWHLGPDRERTGFAFEAVARGLVPVPMPEIHFWNNPVVDLLGPFLPVLGAALLAAVTWIHFRHRAALALWTAATAATLAFTYAKFEGGLRHHGHLFLAYLAASWIAAAADAEAGSSGGRVRRGALAVLLSVHALAGLGAAGADAVLPFSAAGATARFLREAGLDRLPLVGDNDSTASAVAAALGRPIHYPRSGRTSTFVVWDLRRKEKVSDIDVLAAAHRVRGAPEGLVVLVLDHALDPLPDGITLAIHFDRTVIANEGYFVYLDWRGLR